MYEKPERIAQGSSVWIFVLVGAARRRPGEKQWAYTERDGVQLKKKKMRTKTMINLST